MDLNRNIFKYKNTLNDRQLALFLNELSLMLSCGLSLNKSLDSMRQKPSDKDIGAFLDRLDKGLKSGEDFAFLLSRETFKGAGVLSALVRAGERSGRLSESLGLMASYYRKKSELDRKFVNSLIYPIVLVISCFLVVVFILNYVMPSFISLFEDSSRELPTITRLLISISSFFSTYGVFLLIFILFLFIFLFIFYRKNRSFKIKIDALSLKLPIFGLVFSYELLSNTALIISILTSCGTDFLEIIDIILLSTKNSFIKQNIALAREKISRGENFSFAFEKTGLFPELFISMISLGEENASLDKTMEKAYLYYEEDFSYRMTRIVSLFEPFLIIIMAFVVLFIVLAIAIPMFDLVTYSGL